MNVFLQLQRLGATRWRHGAFTCCCSVGIAGLTSRAFVGSSLRVLDFCHFNSFHALFSLHFFAVSSGPLTCFNGGLTV